MRGYTTAICPTCLRYFRKHSHMTRCARCANTAADRRRQEREELQRVKDEYIIREIRRWSESLN